MRAPISKKLSSKGTPKKLATKKTLLKKGKDVVAKKGLKGTTTTKQGTEKGSIGTKRKLAPRVEDEENDEEDVEELEDIDGLTARDLEVLNRLGDNDADSESDDDFKGFLGGDDYEDDMQGLAEDDEDELEGLEGLGDDDEEGDFDEDGEDFEDGDLEDFEGEEGEDDDEFDEDEDEEDNGASIHTPLSLLSLHVIHNF